MLWFISSRKLDVWYGVNTKCEKSLWKMSNFGFCYWKNIKTDFVQIWHAMESGKQILWNVWCHLSGLLCWAHIYINLEILQFESLYSWHNRNKKVVYRAMMKTTNTGFNFNSISDCLPNFIWIRSFFCFVNLEHYTVMMRFDTWLGTKS